jgi:hypothetical protein
MSARGGSKKDLLHTIRKLQEENERLRTALMEINYKADVEEWPKDVMCRLLLPVPMREMGAITSALGAVARKDGKDARMRQVGSVLEIYTVQNEGVERQPKDVRSHAGSAKSEWK